MEDEINNYIKVWLQVLISLFYGYAIGKFVPTGILRLFAILPIVVLFLTLPLHLHSVHLAGTFSFFITWLANLKLLLFAFGKGPLSDPSIPLERFVAIASFPIKVQENPSPKLSQNGTTPSLKSHTNDQNSPSQKPPTNGHTKSRHPPVKTQKKGHKSLLNYAIKSLFFAALIRGYDYSPSIHPTVLLILYCLHVYLCLEIILAMVAALVRNLLSIELEPQFDEPYLSTSLQDFWGRRWNIAVTKILRPTVYEPVLNVAASVMDRRWAQLPAVLTTFLVSGLMHELMFYYLGRLKPTWEVTCFFLLHGFCLILEIILKKILTGKLQLPRPISAPLTVGFVMVTAFWLFFPQLLRCKSDERALQEYAALGAFLKNVSRLTFDESKSS